MIFHVLHFTQTVFPVSVLEKELTCFLCLRQGVDYEFRLKGSTRFVGVHSDCLEATGGKITREQR